MESCSVDNRVFLQFVGYVYVDYVRDLDDRRSTTG